MKNLKKLTLLHSNDMHGDFAAEQLKHAILRMLRDEALTGAHTEFYQLSAGLEVEYDQKPHSFLKFNFEGEPVADDRIIASSCIQIIEETLINGTHQNAKGTGRLIIHNEDGSVTGMAV